MISLPMTITPSEFDRINEARDLLDAMLRAAGLSPTVSWYDRALTEVEVQLEVLRRKWSSHENPRRFRTD